MSSAFFSGDSEAFQVKVPAVEKPWTSIDVQTIYEVPQSVRWINDNDFKRVALQFPDNLLYLSAQIAQLLAEKTSASVFILADTYYGSCCVDEVAGEHYAADAMIHYGHACLSPTSRLPVMYVFGQQPVDLEQLCEQFRKTYPDTESAVIFIYDVDCSYIVDSCASKLAEYKHVVFSNLCFPNNPVGPVENTERTLSCMGRKYTLAEGRSQTDYSFFYLGTENLFLSNFIMTHNNCQFDSYNPVTKICRREGAQVNKHLMRRYYMVEKAKDASIVGILVGTLGVKDYLKTVNSLKDTIKKAGKKSYTFVVGKLNVPKLANFAEVDVYVVVACAENSLVDSSEFYKPVVTPYEMELACNPEREWTGQCVLEFRELLPGGEHHRAMPDRVEAHMDISLITGGVRQMGVMEGEPTVSSTALMSREDNLQVSNTAGRFLSERSWQGLDPQLGQTPVTKAQEGTSGIAMAYTNEPNS